MRITSAMAQFERLLAHLDRMPVRRQAEAVGFLSGVMEGVAPRSESAVRLRLLSELVSGGAGSIHPDDVMPSPGSWDEYADAAAQMIGNEGEIHLLTEADFVAERAVEYWKSSGLEVVRSSIPFDLAPESDMLEFMQGRPSDYLYWALARHRR